jgi:hypothetical protein
LITIRHVYQEAIALSTYFEQKGWSREQEYQPAKEYVKKLEEWSETIRYPKNSLKKADFEDVIRSLRAQLSKAAIGQAVITSRPVRSRVPPPPLPTKCNRDNPFLHAILTHTSVSKHEALVE